MSSSTYTKRLSGVILTLAIAVGAMFLGDWWGINTILLALILGILIGNIASLPHSWDAGIKTASGLFLEFAIILMAFSIDYGSFLKLGWETILIVVVTMAVVLIATVWLGKKMNCPSSAGLLVGFGTAICGSTAIAALAPSVSEDKSDMGIAMAVVNLYGLLGMIFIPLLTAEWLTDVQNSVLIGASLHSVGNVAGAGFAMSDAIGELAVTVKLGRVALLTPALLIFTQFTGKGTETSQKGKFKLPYYLVAFILISIAVSIVPIPTDLLLYSKQGSNFLLATAMAAIGLKVSFKTLLTSGKKGLVFGAILFAVQLVVIVGLMFLL
ncbi:MAG: putative sulfate exporter family transporter [Bacteroidia bacterium]